MVGFGSKQATAKQIENLGGFGLNWLVVVASVFTLSSVAVKWFVVSPVIQFFVFALTIVPLAALMGQATESISAHAGPRLGGLLSATFGNAVELIIGVFSLRQGLFELVKASITGSILGNLLFVLGLSFFVGGIRHPIQTFNLRAARSNAAMLILGIGVAFVVPSVFAAAGSSQQSSETLSIGAGAISLAIYVLGLLFSLFTHREFFVYVEEQDSTDKVPYRLGPALLMLLAVTCCVSLESDWLVTNVTSIATTIGWSEVFIGVIVVALIGNAAEHASAVWMAWKNRMDLSLEIAMGSTLQVAMFIAPLLMFLGLAMHHPFALLFSWPELASMISAVLLVVVLLVDGESNWLEGAMAVGAYLVLAVGFYTLPGS